MLSRALDQILLAASVLPDHLAVARRAYGDRPETAEALERLEAALQEARAALGPRSEPAARRAAS